MKTPARVLTLIGTILVAACGAEPSGGVLLSDGLAPEIERLGPWHYTGIDDARRTVVSSEAAWRAVWRALYGRQTPAPEPPAVDFDRDIVVLVAMGNRGSGGFVIGVEDVTRAGDALHVAVLETAPGPTCVVTQALTQPVDAVIVRGGRGLSVQFVERDTLRTC
jgi:hypothetical protein